MRREPGERLAGRRVPSERATRVGDQIQKEVADLLRNEVKDPRVGSVTVTHVDVSADLSHANIHFTNLAGRAHVLRELAEMRVAGRHLRPRVADADHRPAVELVVRDALVLHPRAVDEAVAVEAAEHAIADGHGAHLRSAGRELGFGLKKGRHRHAGFAEGIALERPLPEQRAVEGVPRDQRPSVRQPQVGRTRRRW